MAGELVHFGQASSFSRPWSGFGKTPKAGRSAALGGPVVRHEELAVQAVESAVPFGGAGDQLGRERLLAVRTHHRVRAQEKNLRCALSVTSPAGAGRGIVPGSASR